MKKAFLTSVIGLSPMSMLAVLSNIAEQKKSSKKNKAEEPKILQKVFKVADVIANKNNTYTRKMTICVMLTDDNKIRAGYSVLNVGDEYDHDKGKTISIGRAISPKTNLFKDKDFKLVASCQLTKEYGRTMLKSIANSIIKDIEDGNIIIKGIV